MIFKKIITVFLTLLFITCPCWAGNESVIRTIPYGRIDPELLVIGYSGDEILEYDISWTGGIKIGELHLEIKKLKDADESYEIKAFITTKGGLINAIYPVNDTHITHVRGKKRLPYRYEIWQKEGYNYEAHRLTEYDQKNGDISLLKNNKAEGEFHVSGEVNNEFSSFFNSRLMALEVGKEIELAYTRAVNQLVNTDDGKIFLQIMLAYCGVFNYNESVNQAQDLIDKGKKGVWLKMIRPYLKKENIMKVEI